MPQKTGFLTTHVLDTARGTPASAMAIQLYRLDGDTRHLLNSLHTNEDGRTDSPILPQEDFKPGLYELDFAAGAYLDRLEGEAKKHRFLDRITIRFGIEDACAHYHVPLLFSPFGYSTYRGS